MFEHAVDATLIFAFLNRLALVKLALTSACGNDQLSQSALVDEQTQGDDGDARLLCVAGEAAYLLAVQEKLAVTVGRVVVI